MRLAALCLAGLTGLLIAVVPALAKDESVTASGFAFTPKSVTIKVGDSVSWTNPGSGGHNVKFTDGQFEVPSDPSPSWPPEVKRTFSAAGTYSYYCEIHGDAQGGGMSGTVVVEPDDTTTGTATPTASATASASPTSTATAAPSSSPTASPTSSPGPTGVGTQVVFDARLGRRPFTSRGRNRGIRVIVDLDDTQPQVLTTTLEKRNSRGRLVRFGRLRLIARPGTRTYRFQETTTGRKIGPGRYRLTIEAASRAQRFLLTVR